MMGEEIANEVADVQEATEVKEETETTTTTEAEAVTEHVEAELVEDDDEINPFDPVTGLRSQVMKCYELVQNEDEQALWPNACLVPLLPESDEPYPANDKGNARRFLEQCGAYVRYCPEQKTWYRFDGTRWVPEEETRIRKMAQDALDRSYAEEKAQLELQRDYKKLEKLERRIEKIGNVATVKNCIAKAAEEATIRPQDFDKDIYLFHAKNAVLDLKHLEITVFHVSDQYLTQMANANFPLNARDARTLCPQWHNFVMQCCMYDENLYMYLKAAVAYSILTGDISEQKMFILLGGGRNGKSLFINTLAYVAGDYAKKLKTAVLCLNKYGDKDNDVEKEKARVQGSRFLYSNEFSRNSILNEAFIKEITDGGGVSARANYKDGMEYMPTYTLWISSNHMPNLQAMDEGIRRRIIIIPFRNHLEEHEVDRNLPEKLKAEADGILAWLVQGYLIYNYNKRKFKQGLRMPDVVKEATEGYFEEQDVFQCFIDENYKVDETARILAQDVYPVYTDWCKRNGEIAVSLIKLGKELKNRGILKVRETEGICYGLAPCKECNKNVDFM